MMPMRYLFALLLLVPATAWAQATSSVTPPCDGVIAIVRTSELTGSRSVFLEAVADHERWYRGHGVTTNRFLTAPVYELRGDVWVEDTTKVLTFHVNAPSRTPQSDAAWKAFSDKYASVSKILTRTVACLPRDWR